MRLPHSLLQAVAEVKTVAHAQYDGPPRVFTSTSMFARLRAALSDAQLALQAAERELLRQENPHTALAPPPVASGMGEPLAAYLEQELHALVMLLFYTIGVAQQQGLPIELAWDRYIAAIETGDVNRRLYFDLVERHAHQLAPEPPPDQ